MRKILISLIGFMLCGCQYRFSDGTTYKIISGNIYGPDGLPMEGVSVVAGHSKSSDVSASYYTNPTGHYIITINPRTKKIHFMKWGYRTQKIKPPEGNSYDIHLERAGSEPDLLLYNSSAKLKKLSPDSAGKAKMILDYQKHIKRLRNPAFGWFWRFLDYIEKFINTPWRRA